MTTTAERPSSLVRLSDFEYIQSEIAGYTGGLPALELAILVSEIKTGRRPLPPPIHSGAPGGVPAAPNESAPNLRYSDICARILDTLPCDKAEAARIVRAEAGRILGRKDIDVADRQSSELRAKAAELALEADALDRKNATRLAEIERCERRLTEIETELAVWRESDFDAMETQATSFVSDFYGKMDRTPGQHQDLEWALRTLSQLPHLRAAAKVTVPRLENELSAARKALESLSA